MLWQSCDGIRLVVRSVTNWIHLSTADRARSTTDRGLEALYPVTSTAALPSRRKFITSMKWIKDVIRCLRFSGCLCVRAYRECVCLCVCQQKTCRWIFMKYENFTYGIVCEIFWRWFSKLGLLRLFTHGFAATNRQPKPLNICLSEFIMVCTRPVENQRTSSYPYPKRFRRFPPFSLRGTADRHYAGRPFKSSMTINVTVNCAETLLLHQS